MTIDFGEERVFVKSLGSRGAVDFVTRSIVYLTGTRARLKRPSCLV
ncbi:hypothetical protein CKA32_003359 [Geitlerinema sp. FC II]|nr:hypothetical protein CKA32_003359 [Geitlerinema sp. FC II]